MGVLVAERIDRPASLFGPSPTAPAEQARDGGLGGGLSLDEAIVGAWEGLAAQATVACPLCGGRLRPRSTATANDVGGRCGDCGTTLE